MSGMRKLPEYGRIRIHKDGTTYIPQKVRELLGVEASLIHDAMGVVLLFKKDMEPSRLLDSLELFKRMIEIFIEGG